MLSDVLPYELPIIMSNRSLYRFCVKNKISYNVQRNMLAWDKHIDSDSFEVLKLLFKPAFDSKCPAPLKNDEKAVLTPYSTIPFIFHILHKDTEFRALSLIHPAMQIAMVDFYNQYKSLLIHYCTRSHFSMRYPQRVASFFYYKDKLHNELLGTKKDKIELFFNEYENLKTFFPYKKYTQIYRFYDDYRFQRAEKRFSHLLRFDIQKCFDSIYTHTIAWATQGGKQVYKKSFSGHDSSSFGGIFDTVMQRLNYNETSGIVIGPEFSRIFAEIILQHVDRSVEYAMEQHEPEYKNGRDYQLYRYVDDYFLFYNDNLVKSRVIELLHRQLEEYRLKISREKTIEFERPFITEISRAKILIDTLIDKWFKYRTSLSGSQPESDEDEKDINEGIIEDVEPKIFVPDEKKLHDFLSETGYFPLVSRKFNQEFKNAICTVGVKAKDVLNYTLSCVFTRVERELKKFNRRHRYLKLAVISKAPIMTEERKKECLKYLEKIERQLIRYLVDVVDSSFFLLSLCKRLNSSLKLTRILNAIIIYLNGEHRYMGEVECMRFDKELRQRVFGQIHNEVVNILSRSTCHEYAQLEVLYLLIIMRLIESTHPIPEQVLIDNIGLDGKPESHLNLIAINVLLYYIGNKNAYRSLKHKLISHIEHKIDAADNLDFCKDSESIIFILDLACCPYLDRKQKKALYQRMHLTTDEINHLLSFGRKNKFFFTKWSGVDVTKELASKISQEVYS